MNKAEIIMAMSDKSGLTRKESESALAAFLETIEETLKGGEKVSLVGFGTFEAKTRAAHEGINPKTKEKIKIAASKAPTFKAGTTLKGMLNE